MRATILCLFVALTLGMLVGALEVTAFESPVSPLPAPEPTAVYGDNEGDDQEPEWAPPAREPGQGVPTPQPQPKPTADDGKPPPEQKPGRCAPDQDGRIICG